jgi:hypothetical protein
VLVDPDLEDLLEDLLDDDLVLRPAGTLGKKHVAVVGELFLAAGVAAAPAEKVAERRKRGLRLEDAGRLAPVLELLKDGDDELGVRGRDPAPLVEDLLELRLGDVVEVDLEEAVAEGAREHLAAAVEAGRVLRCKQHEVRVGPDDLARLGDDELAVVVEQPVERLEDVGRREVELVEDDPVAPADGPDEDALLEDELARLGVRDVRAEVLLDVSVLVVIDADKAVTGPSGEVLNRRRLAG